jgi:hypothetical protein
MPRKEGECRHIRQTEEAGKASHGRRCSEGRTGQAGRKRRTGKVR